MEGFWRAELPVQRLEFNTSNKPKAICSLVLSLQMLGSFGGTIRIAKVSGNYVPLLPFVQGVAMKYLAHSSSEVCKAAAMTCCTLLLPYEIVQESCIGGTQA